MQCHLMSPVTSGLAMMQLSAFSQFRKLTRGHASSTRRGGCEQSEPILLSKMRNVASHSQRIIPTDESVTNPKLSHDREM